MKKKLLPALLALAMALSLLPLAAFAAEGDSGSPYQCSAAALSDITGFDSGKPTDNFQNLTITKEETTREGYTYTFKVTGEIKKVTGWTGYSEAEKDGYFAAIKITGVPNGTTYTVGPEGNSNTGTADNDGIVALTNLATSTDGLKDSTFTTTDSKQKAMLVTISKSNAEAEAVAEEGETESETYLFLFGEVKAVDSLSTGTPNPGDEENPPVVTSTPAMVFSKVAGTTKIFDVEASKMANDDLQFTLDPATKVVTVAGSVKYLTEYTGFWPGNTEMQEGHFLPVGIEIQNVGESGGKLTVNNGNTADVATNDRTGEIVMRLDGLTNMSFPLKYTEGTGSDATGIEYTVDCSRVTLLPKVSEGASVSPTQDGKVEVTVTNTGSVSLPADKVGNVEIKVEAKTNISSEVTSATAVGNAIKAALTASGAKAVEVTIKGSNGSELTDDLSSVGGSVTVTIEGLTDGKVYHMFSLSSGSAVSYYGYKTAQDGKISLTTKHLTTIVASPEDQIADRAAFGAELQSGSVKDDTADSGLSKPSTAEADGVSAVYTRSTNVSGMDYYGGKLTVNGLTGNAKYVILLQNKNNAAVRLSYVVTTDNTGTVSVSCPEVVKVIVFTVKASAANLNDTNPDNVFDMSKTYFQTTPGVGTDVTTFSAQ